MMSRSAKIGLASFVGLAGCIEAERGASEANASEPRAGSHFSDRCRVQMDDSLNVFTTYFHVVSDEHKGALSFIVHDEGQDWTVEGHFDSRNSPLDAGDGIPHDTLNEIRERFKSDVATFASKGVLVHGQLTYTLVPGAECTRDEFAMIHFLVFEWFYFG